MRDHPLTPMTDANLVRVLQAQLATAPRDGVPARRVGLVDHRATGDSAAAIGERFGALQAEGVGDRDRRRDRQRRPASRSAPPLKDLPLVCAGSGLAIGLPANFGIAAVGRRDGAAGGAAAFAPSSPAAAPRRRNAQVAHFERSGGAARRVDPLALGGGASTERSREIARLGRARVDRDADATGARLQHGARRKPSPRRRRLGAATSAQRLEALLAAIARALVERGARRLVVAGGETSGACVQALGVRQLRIGAQIDPGVPWCHAAPALAPDGMHLALKSGNFGGVDFFSRAFAAPT